MGNISHSFWIPPFSQASEIERTAIELDRAGDAEQAMKRLSWIALEIGSNHSRDNHEKQG